jgi:tetraacyldisaccharide 4'-kinase
MIATWWGEESHPLFALLRVPLLPFAGAFAAAAALRSAAYGSGLLRVRRLPAPVVSIGNLTVGGTGKTPMVRWVARRLLDAGRRTLVFSSGFGARAAGSALDEEGAFLARALPGAQVLQGSDPAADIAAAFRSPGPPPDAIVLDDGFQKRSIARDVDVVMLDATRPFGSGLPLPAGPLRERKGALARASAIVLSRTELCAPEETAALRASLSARWPAIPVLRQRHEPAGLVFSKREPTALRGAGVWLLSAIAHPRAFQALVTRLGARVLGHTSLRDHAPFTAAMVADTLARARSAGADLVLCSTKDAPKIERFAAGASPPIDALDIAVVFDDDPAPLLSSISALFPPPTHAVATHRA